MSDLAITHTNGERQRLAVGPGGARTVLLGAVLLAAAGGVLATDGATASRMAAAAGADWAHLLRAMAALKVVFALAGTAAVFWRLGAAVTVPRP